MAQLFQVHPEHPQPRLIKQAAEIARSGGLIALPTDSAYSLAGVSGYAPLLDRIRRIRGVDERHHFTLMCRQSCWEERSDSEPGVLVLDWIVPSPRGDDAPLADADEIRARLEKQLDLIIDAGRCGIDMTTVINLTSVEPELVRAGQGPLEPFGLDG